MINLRFENYRYYPTLRTRTAEMKGLQMLDDSRKSKILPLITMGQWPKAVDFSRSAEKVVEVMGDGYFLLDLTNDTVRLAAQHQQLRRPDSGYENWRDFVSQYPTAVPVVQMSPDARTRDVTRQAQELERSTGKLAFRIREFSNETRLVINALSALDDPTNAIVFVDCQYVRNALAAFATATVASINQVRAEFPEAIISVLSTSFPSSTAPFADASQQRGSIDILERDLHSRIGGDAVAIYGDHGSIHSVVYDDAPIMRWAARIDYPRELDWYFERRPGNQSEAGYIDAAAAVVAANPDIGGRDIWGETMIRQAAEGAPFGKGPAPWIAARVNIHLSRQIDLSEQEGEPEEDDFSDLV